VRRKPVDSDDVKTVAQEVSQYRHVCNCCNTAYVRTVYVSLLILRCHRQTEANTDCRGLRLFAANSNVQRAFCNPVVQSREEKEEPVEKSVTP
jgi:hypothetical protein